jgi:hypothetical protein
LPSLPEIESLPSPPFTQSSPPLAETVSSPPKTLKPLLPASPLKVSPNGLPSSCSIPVSESCPSPLAVRHGLAVT